MFPDYNLDFAESRDDVIRLLESVERDKQELREECEQLRAERDALAADRDRLINSMNLASETLHNPADMRPELIGTGESGLWQIMQEVGSQLVRDSVAIDAARGERGE